MFRSILLWLVVVAFGQPALAKPYEFPADQETADFVANEVLATFYHELGHALIDILALPVLGKEEDAADHLSVVMMNNIWDEESAVQILASDATAFALRADQSGAGEEEAAYADVHSLDAQRYYNVVCLFYGANPDKRAGFAEELGLPQDRAETCPDEWQAAASSWDAVLADASDGAGKKGLVMAAGQEGQPLADLLAEELGSINERFGLPVEVSVRVDDCGEANAYYTTEDHSITLCNEYAQDLQDLWEAE